MKIEIETFLNENNLTDLDEFKRRTGLAYIEKGDDFDCTVSGDYIKFIRATHLCPSEGGYCENIIVLVENFDITDILYPDVFFGLSEELCDSLSINCNPM